MMRGSDQAAGSGIGQTKSDSSESAPSDHALDLAPLHEHLGFQVHLTWRALKKRMLLGERRSQKRTQRGAYSIPLLIAKNPGVAPQEIADVLFLDSSRVAFLLRDLEARKLVERVPSKTDRRKVGLHLNEAGLAWADEALMRSKEIEASVGSSLSADERRTLIRLLTKLRDSG